MARRDDREYLLYLREEQRRQPGAPAARFVRGGVEEGCPARELCREPRGQDTSQASSEVPFQNQILPFRLLRRPSTLGRRHEFTGEHLLDVGQRRR